MSHIIIVKFNHDDGIIHVLEMGNAIRSKMGADRGDRTGGRSLSRDVREGVSHEVKREGRSWVTLPEAPAVSEKNY